VKRRIFNAIAVLSLAISIWITLLPIHFPRSMNGSRPHWANGWGSLSRDGLNYQCGTMALHSIRLPFTEATHLHLLGLDYYSEGPRYRSLHVPAWAIFCVLLALPAARVFATYQSHRPLLKGRCAKCGYDLRATRERCPECGAVPGEVAERVRVR